MNAHANKVAGSESSHAGLVKHERYPYAWPMMTRRGREQGVLEYVFNLANEQESARI